MRTYSARTIARLKALCTLPAVALTIASSTPAFAQAAAASTLGAALGEVVAASPLRDRIGLSVVDLATGKPVFAVDEHTPRNPASNMKLLTAAAAMTELGPDFQMRTGLHGRVVGTEVTGPLCLKGTGDPTLRTADLVQFARRLSDEGVRSVSEVIVDGTYFDDQVLPPAFDQQPGEVAPFRAAVAAVSVNANAYTLRVRPGASEGAAAIATVDAAGYFEIDNGLTTSAKGTPTVIADQRGSEEKLSLTLRGSLPLGTSSMAFGRRVEAPLHYAGHALLDALRAVRIQVPKRVSIGACPGDAPIISLHLSAPLSEILARLGKDSDNFVAEMVLKVLAAERRRKPGRSADGVSVTLDALKRMGVKTEGLAMVNGSGLFDGNKVSASQLAQVLTAMHQNPSFRDDYIAHLAVGGADGTLSRRFRTLPIARIVRAKTGTLDSVIALAGYVLGPTPNQTLAFGYIAQGIQGKQADARALIDKLVETMAAHLYPPKHP